MWTALEPIHAVVYFAPEARERYGAIGLHGFWRGYFASRSAPLGVVPAPVVTAAFFGFHPSMVERAIPDVWTRTTPEAAWSARQDVARVALARVVEEDVAEAVAVLRSAVAACRPEGRVLFAAHAALPWPDDPVLALWHAATLLREHRGDGHVAALVAAGLDACQAHVTAAAGREHLQQNRGWSNEEWTDAEQRLAGVDVAALRASVEDATDRAASPPWDAIGDDATDRLHEQLLPIARRIVAAGAIPVPNPMGVPGP